MTPVFFSSVMKFSSLLLLLFHPALLIQAIEIDAEEDLKTELEAKDGLSFFDTLKTDRCDSSFMAKNWKLFLHPIPFPGDPDGMNRYPLHVAIMHKSYICVQLIIHHFQQADEEDSEIFTNNIYYTSKQDKVILPLLLLNHEDYFGKRAIDYAIKYFPSMASKFLTSEMLNYDTWIAKIIETAMHGNPSLHLELLIIITLRSKNPQETFFGVLRAFINSTSSNLAIYRIFLEDYLKQILTEQPFGSDVFRNIFEGEKIRIGIYSDLVCKAIDRSCYSFLKSTALLPLLTAVSEKDAEMAKVINIWVMKAASTKDPLISKYLLNLLSNLSWDLTDILEFVYLSKAISKSLWIEYNSERQFHRIDSYSSTRKRIKNNKVMYPQYFAKYLPLAFDLKFIPAEPTDEISEELRPFVDTANEIRKVLDKDAFEPLSEEEKIELVSGLPKFVLTAIPVGLMMALHNPDALYYLPADRRADLMDTPVYSKVGPDGNDVVLIPTVLDLIGCYAPKAFPYSWAAASGHPANHYAIKTLNFVFSADCHVASSVKSELLRHYQFDTLKIRAAINSGSKFVQFNGFLFDKSTEALEAFIDYLVVNTRNYELIYRIASGRNIQLSLPQIYAIITKEDSFAKSKLQHSSNFEKEALMKAKMEIRTGIIAFLNYIYKFNELGFKEAEVRLDHLSSLQRWFLELLSSPIRDVITVKRIKVLLLRLWQSCPELVNAVADSKTKISLFRYLLNIKSSETALDLLNCLCASGQLKLSKEDLEAAESKVTENNNGENHYKYKFYRDFAADKIKINS